MDRINVFELIEGERKYQNNKWNKTTTETEGRHTPDEFILYMLDYLEEAKHILSRESANTGRPKAMEIIRKVTSMGVAAMEQHETKPRDTD